MDRSKQVISTERAPAPSHGAPYSQAITFGDLIFVAGQLPLDPVSGETVAGSIAEHTTQALENMRQILEAAGSGMNKLLRTTVYLTERDHWAPMNEVYARYVGATPPARTAVTVDVLPYGSLIEIDAIAHR